ncbi:MAG: hypothetical protein LBE55_01325 [Clostridiales bacterium]|jgi:alpha-tubulin suppressor-like RCC1 family protein|nr:hypothetical protein [Clostridiales bacterium]
MKKLLSAILALVLAAGIFMPASLRANEIGVSVSVIINGRPVAFESQGPINIDGHMLVPARAVFQALGFAVEWDGAARTSTLTRGGDTIIITADSAVFAINGENRELDVPAQIINGTMMLPIRTVAESAGYVVSFNAETNTVGIASVTRAAIALGASRSYAIQDDGNLWVWGLYRNEFGEEQDGMYGARFAIVEGNYSTVPIRVMEDVAAVSAGGLHTMAIKNDGSLWAWGHNTLGQLGNGEVSDLDAPIIQPIKIMDGVIAVSAGNSHTMAITADGVLWAWGSNWRGALGDGTGIDRHSPVRVMDDVASVAAGHSFTMAARTDGSLWVWGDNQMGQLGDGTTEYRFGPRRMMEDVAAISIEGFGVAAIGNDGGLWTWGGWGSQLDDGTEQFNDTPTRKMDDVIAVSASDHHTMAVTADGTLWGWGSNWRGALGDGTEVYRPDPVRIMDGVAAVAAAGSATMAVRADGSLWTWGDNQFGQLGNGTTETQFVPIRIMENVMLPPK